MDTKVRDLFEIETRDLVNIINFRKVYSVFEQIVLYDIDVPDLEGLGERLQYAFNKIATDKLDRNDIITYFPIIWGKFETYARMILFLVNRKEYNKLTKDDSLVNVLEKLGLKVFVTKNDRNERTDAIYNTYNVRNTDAHKCEKWSIKTFYETLQYVLAAYLIVTENSYEQLEKKMAQKGISTFCEDEVIIKGIDILDRYYKRFDNLSTVNDKIISIIGRDSERHFDEKGLLVKEVFHGSDGFVFKTDFEYEYKDDMPILQKRITRRYHKEKQYEEETDTRLYHYDYDDRLSMIEVLDEKRRKGESRTIKIEYLTNGGILIKDTHVRPAIRGKEDPSVQIEARRYNSKGALLSVENGEGNIYCKYTYEDEHLIEIWDARTKIEIDYIGDNVIKKRWSSEKNDYVILSKQRFQDGRLIEIVGFDKDGKEGGKVVIEYKK